MVISINAETMRINECFSRISGSHTGYISHSFNQFIAIDGEDIYTLNQGDTRIEGAVDSRGAVLSHYPMQASSGRFHDAFEKTYMSRRTARPSSIG